MATITIQKRTECFSDVERFEPECNDLNVEKQGKKGPLVLLILKREDNFASVDYVQHECF
jgi:hypothetical protein